MRFPLDTYHHACFLSSFLRLYADPGCPKSVQGKISGLLNELEEWSKAALPGGCQAAQEKHKTGFEREQFLLKADYWSAIMVVTRPCLCRIERRIRSESSASAEFNTTSAEACVKAALEMTKLFPDEPDLDFIYSKGPWWAVVHLSKSPSHAKYATWNNFEHLSHAIDCDTPTRDGLQEQGYGELWT